MFMPALHGEATFRFLSKKEVMIRCLLITHISEEMMVSYGKL
jgi:hypothetical protein